jgi:hypothetical protein
LLGQKRQVQEQARGRVPERLVRGTVQTVMHLARQTAAEVPSGRVLQLVRHVLGWLDARHSPKVDTALFLRRGPAGNRGEEHGANQ